MRTCLVSVVLGSWALSACATGFDLAQRDSASSTASDDDSDTSTQDTSSESSPAATEDTGSGSDAPSDTAVSTVSQDDSNTVSSDETDFGSSSDETDFGSAPEDLEGQVEVGVRNLCPFPLWIHAAGSTGVLEPDDTKLEVGETRWYGAPNEWSAARITAYSEGPRTKEIEKIEATFADTAGGPVLNYNVTYVDWVGLPVEVEGVGGGADCRKAGCAVPVEELLDGCPSALRELDRCQSARSYCLNAANQGETYCHALDSNIALCAATKDGCAAAAGATTGEVYACSGSFFSGSPKWCAALNRGMLDDPDNPDSGLYYQKEPYNTYSQWVHERCPGLYAFPYDDYPSNAGQSGFHACAEGRELHVTFCPKG